MLALKLVANLLHGDEFHSLVLLEMLDKPKSKNPVLAGDARLEISADRLLLLPFVHQYDLRTSRYVRVDADGEDELIVFPVAVVELVPPEILDIPGVDESVAIGRRFYEHHRGQVVQVPARRDLHQTSLLALDERLHPRLCLLCVVNLGPCVARTQVVGLAIVMHHRVVVLNAVVQQQLAALLTTLPPGGNTSPGGLADELSQHPIRLVEYVSLLLDGHV
jgi:hypothetical protein